ncbi:hypothetical protein D3C86_1285810 [compost metagenome]
MPPVQQPLKHGGKIALPRQNGAHLHGVGCIDAGPGGDKRRFHPVDPQTSENRLILVLGPWQAKIVQAGTVDELRHLTTAARRSHQELLRHSPLLCMQQEGLLRGKRPGVAKAVFQIGADEIPVGGIPGGGFSNSLVRASRNVPAVDDRADETLPGETFTLNPREILRANDGPPLLLKRVERLQSVS